MRLLTGHAFQVRRVQFSSDGGRLLACSSCTHHEARVWDLRTGESRWHVRGDTFGGAAFTPDGAGVVLADFLHGPSVLDLEALTATPVPPGRGANPHLVAMPVVSPDGSLVAGWGRVGAGEIVPGWWRYPGWDWRPPSSTEVWLSGLEKWVFSADGRYLADMTSVVPPNSVVPPRVTVLEAGSGRVVREFPFEMKQGMAAVAFHPDGERLAIASGNQVRIVEGGRGRDVATLRQARKYFLGVAFTPDGRYLGTASNEESVTMYDTSTWRPAREYAWRVGGLKCLTFSPDGTLGAAAGDKKKVVVWDVDG